MSLPSACEKCPYRRILQQWLGNWDAGLMKDNGIYDLQMKVKKLEEELNRLRPEPPPESSSWE